MKTTLIALLAASFMAQAQTSSTSLSAQEQGGESSAKIQDLQKKDEQMKDIDQEITNNKLRAELGSKSKWSFRSALNYQGGTIKKAFSEERPEIRAEGETNEAVGFSADVAVKYRTTDNTSLNFGTGITVDKLFHRTFNEAVNADAKNNRSRNGNISDPYLEFNIANKLGSIQNFASLTYTHYTYDYYTDVLQRTGSVTVQDVALTEVGNSSLGLAFAYYHYLYDTSGNSYANGAMKTEAGTYLSPFYEYAFNDKYNFRTVFNWFTFSKKMGDGDFRQVVAQQSMGIGISITRDIYLYPNVQFIPQDIRADRTNVALAANINLF